MPTWAWGCCVPPAPPCAVHTSTTGVTVYLAGELRDRVAVEAVRSGRRLADVVNEAVREYLERPA